MSIFSVELQKCDLQKQDRMTICLTTLFPFSALDPRKDVHGAILGPVMDLTAPLATGRSSERSMSLMQTVWL